MTEKITNIDKQSGNPADKDAPREMFPEGDSMDRFVRVFETSARRWELVIYPAMLAFVVLAAYGFFSYLQSEQGYQYAGPWHGSGDG